MSYSIIRLDGNIVGLADQEGNGIGALRWFHENKPSCSMDHACQFEGYSVEDVESLDEVEGGAEAVLSGIMTRLGLRVGFKFVPFSQSKNAKPDPLRPDGKPWKSLNWVCDISRDLMGDRPPFLTGVEYSAGVGHCPAEGKRWAFPAAKQAAIELEIETGKVAASSHGAAANCYATRQPIIPNPVDIVAAVVRDADALDSSFEDWAENLGYSTDSRSAERIYQTCLAYGVALRSALGNSKLVELQTAAREL